MINRDYGTCVYVTKTVDEALKKFKKRVERFRIMDEIKSRQFYDKPSVVKHKAILKTKYRIKKYGPR